MLGMTLTTQSFFIFLGITFALFYIFKPAQKYILMIASIFFYIAISNASLPMTIGVMAYISLVTYIGALLVDRLKGGAKRAVFILFLIGLIAPLVVFKYLYNLAVVFAGIFNPALNISVFEVVSIIGMSYFVLSAIGYLVEVYWESFKADKNFPDVLLFIFYFPQMISGPVTRYQAMKTQFNTVHKLSYENFNYGARRMLWGYFKKFVISENFAIIVSTVFDKNANFGGASIIFGVICYAIRLYTDFSGCMDIIMGASSLFGITLPENFRAPFCSRSIQEFWQRWHITLGTWFKDFVMYPIQISKPMVALSKTCKNKLGKKAGKKIPFYISMLVLWVLIGIWHGGTGYYFVASGVIPFIILTLSDLLSPAFKKMSSVIKNKDNFFFVSFQRVRTIALICICWIFVCSTSISGGFVAIGKIFTDFRGTELLNIRDYLKLDIWNYGPMLIGLVALIIAEYFKNKDSSIYEASNKIPGILRLACLYLEIGLILAFGIVGQSSFIYFQF